jgi:hypothetical protein
MSEVAPFLLLICRLAFAIDEPPPAEAMTMLAHAYGCEVRIEVNFDRVPAPPARQAGAYFPRPSSFWPILGADGGVGLEDEVEDWVEQGVRPGLLLRDDPVSLVLRFEELARLRRAVSLGAIPVMAIERPLEGSVTYGATIYAALGLAPQAVYVVDGYGLDLGLLPAGRHLVAGYWHTPFQAMPLPAEQTNLGPSRFLPVYDGPSPGGGIYATTQEGRGAAFTPDFQLYWSFLGIEFRAGDGGLETGAVGTALMALVQISSFLWAVLGGNWPNLVTAVVALLAWIGIVVAALLFLILPFGILFSRLSRERR